MKNYQKAFDDYLATHPAGLGEEETEDLLDVLFRCYQESRKMDSKEIQSDFKHLDSILSKLSLDDNNRVFLLTCELCELHSKNAFHTGILKKPLQENLQRSISLISRRSC